MTAYHRPTTVAEALDVLSRPPGDGQAWLVIAGGTDVYPARVGRVFAEPMLDVSALDELRGIRETPERYEIGARTTWSDVARATLPPLFDGLRFAAREVGGVQIQNAGTVAGNVCNASPAADGIPPLLAMGASVAAASMRGTRTVPLVRFILGNRRTALAPDELVTAICVPKRHRAAHSGFVKLGTRKYLVISIVMAAAVLEYDEGRITGAGIAVGACSPEARRLPQLEADLVGQPLTRSLGDQVLPAHLSPLSPIDDVRGTAAYRTDAALTLVRRLLNEVGVHASESGARS